MTITIVWDHSHTIVVFMLVLTRTLPCYIPLPDKDVWARKGRLHT